MQIPVLSGIAADATPDFRTTYPVNLVPVPKVQGMSQGYLRTPYGVAKQAGTGGAGRGGILWDGLIYRVCGSNLVSIDSAGTVTTIGDVGATGTVSMAYSFDRLAIAANNKLWYWDKTTLTEVTDADLGDVHHVTWSDGYFITTDGEYIVVTELTDPTAVDPLKYGTAETDPDPIYAVHKIRDEIYAVGRYTIEAFQNIGGTGFPFAVIRGAQVTKGSVGTHASTVFQDGIVMVGGGRGDGLGVHIAGGGQAGKISTHEIDTILEGYSDLSGVVVEAIEDRGHATVMVHLEDQTLCYDMAASASVGQPVWYHLDAGDGLAYRARHFVFANSVWNVTDPFTGWIGVVDRTVSTTWGRSARWQFGTPIVYNAGRRGLVHSVELAGLYKGATVALEWSSDGTTWTTPKSLTVQGSGGRARWLRQGVFTQRRMMRFTGQTDEAVSIAAIEADIEPLAW